MIRPILRFLCPILCLLVLCTWAWTIWNEAGVTYRYTTKAVAISDPVEWKTEWRVIATMGKVHIAYRPMRSELLDSKWEDGTAFYIRPRNTEPLAYRLALHPHVLTEFFLRNGPSIYLNIPFWQMLIVLIPVTMWLWYPWLGDRRNKYRVGFEVETKSDEKSISNPKHK